MAKKRTKSKPPARRKVDKPMAAGRRNTHKANGSLPESQATAPEPEERVNVGEAMRRAVEALGGMKIDDELAVSQLQQLGELYEDVAKRQAAFIARADEAKTAKKSLDAATESLLERLKAFTHPTPLPLFDQAEREADQEEMLDAVDRGGMDEGADAPPF